MTTTESAGSDQEIPALEGGGPELAFRVTRPVAAGGTVSCSMPVGPWLNGPSGRPLAGALGVMIDNVLGHAIMLRRPPGGWSVSAEISLDVCQPVLDDTQVLKAEGRTDYSDATGGVASCSVTDGSGRLIALCRQHGRWVQLTPAAPSGAGAEPGGPVTVPPEGLTSLLGTPAVAADGTAQLDLAVTRELAKVTAANESAKPGAIATVTTGAPA